MLELLNGYSKLSILLEQYQSSERALIESSIQQETLYRMSGEFSRELEQAKTNTNKAIKISKASRDAYVKTIEQLTGHTPEELYNLLPELGAAIEVLQKCKQQEIDLKATYEILAASDAFDEESPREKFEEKLTMANNQCIVARDLAKMKLKQCLQGSEIVVVSEQQVSGLLKI